MRTIVLIIFLTLLNQNVDGQINKKSNIPTYKNGDTTLWYKWQYKLEEKLKLPHLIASADTFHCRFWKSGQVVDIWTTDYKSFEGIITNYTDTYEENEKKKQKNRPSVTFSNKVKIDTSLSRQVFELTKTVSEIPNMDSIEGWRKGFDGVTYFLESSTPTAYSFKDYWSPTAQDSTLIEARLIKEFVEKINSTLNLNAEHEKFFDTLKPGSYTSDYFLIRTKLSDKQMEELKKYQPHKEYLESVRDTLNNYLNDTLTKVFQKNREVACYDYYYLKFSKMNKLKKVKINIGFIDFSDRIEYYKCRRQIRRAFRQVRVDFVHSKVPYWKVLSIWEKKALISQ